ncbi:hypothetical protein BO068_005229 [Escherichia coli]|nr:hypothetical protein [Salmonella enterica subsp. enterica]EBU8089996.1 hypothetical protein [Salmonella enterica subsp. enterica serovar Agona]EBV3600086.1 hypothetical protein [Salmonella enterica subsp. enterica serovar Virchow]EBW1603883.1 hypothetical protein [Salmonella enterica subsp. enterica serovar Kottbus]EBW2353383.1 hypothetical protein [Salmonella enterica subsp. enterica serovar Enteritidis]EBW7423655.1 hypothetical protein [Salmonella enterica subsp. enterica serovar Stanley]
MRKIFIAIAALFSTAAIAGPSVEIQGDAFDRETVEKVLVEFWKACKPLAQHLEDVHTIRVETGEEFAQHRLDKGWKKSFHIAIPLSEELTSLPKSDPEIGAIAGHTLHYHLGGGSQPGMLGSKRVSQKLCGMTVANDGSDTFKKVPSLRLIHY